MKDTVKRRFRLSDIRGYKLIIPVIIIVIMFIMGEIAISGFASLNNIGSILTLSCVVATVTIGQTLVIAAGGDGLDLSVGAVISMSALVVPTTCGGDPKKLFPAMLLALAIAAVVGFINAIGVLYVKLPPLIVTLIMASVVDGFTLAYTLGQPTGVIPDILLNLGKTVFGPIRWLLLVTLILVISVQLFLSYSRLGKAILLVGNNRAAAHISGLKKTQVIFIAYIMGSVIAAIAGILLVGYSGSSIIKMGDSYTMLSVAAAVIGGTNMAGGEGNVVGGFLGAIIFMLLTNLLLALGLASGIRVLIQGLILLLILSIYARGRNLRE